MMNVRLAGPPDAEPIAALMRRCFDGSTLRMTIYGCGGIVRFLETRMRLPLELADCRHVVAQAVAQGPASDPHGFAELRLLEDTICLNYIAIAQQWRGTRAADLLFRYALDLIREDQHQMVILDVFTSNAISCNWYGKLGFEPEHETVWWSVPLQFYRGDSSGAGRCKLSGLPEAMACERVYGFSRFDLSTPRGHYRIGRLGTQWFKTDNPDLMEDESAVACLALLDPGRKMLGLFPSQLNLGKRGGALRLDSSLRMTTGLERLRGRLAERTRS